MKSKQKYQFLPGDNQNNDSVLRVNQAGELGAVAIYRGQIAAQKNPNPILHTMLSHEQVHLRYFNDTISQEKTRPSLLYPLWENLGFAIGYISAKCGNATQHALTVGVELEISAHYQSQINQLPDGQLKTKIKEFQADEEQHRDIALENGAQNMPFYDGFIHAVRFGVASAVRIAQKI